MFRVAATYNDHTDLQEYTETVTACIKECIGDVTVTRCANQKPWMTAEVHGLLNIREEAFRSGDKAALETARANLSHGIKNNNMSSLPNTLDPFQFAYHPNCSTGDAISSTLHLALLSEMLRISAVNRDVTLPLSFPFLLLI
ncbi:hypothetical protein M9458_054234 [Cirrhinus mrigala]|uniref:Dopa decarboxylase n=1 Tax=Cirrhinus mrigala TaxID=683832 RepID=A0ABD0MNQ9_CIRMR